MDKTKELELLINSDTPLIYIETWEEQRVERMLAGIAAGLGIPLFFWTVTGGLQRAGLPNAIYETTEPIAALNRLSAGRTLRSTLDGGARDLLVASLRGLTLLEAERVLAKSIVERGGLDQHCLEAVIETKKELIAQQGILEYVEGAESFEQVGGLRNLKQWLSKRQGAYSREAAAFGLDPPRGILITGVQGCGKSLCAKAVAREWRLPLLKMDAGNLYDKYVGESERRLRQALEMAAALAPARRASAARKSSRR